MSKLEYVLGSLFLTLFFIIVSAGLISVFTLVFGISMSRQLFVIMIGFYVVVGWITAIKESE